MEDVKVAINIPNWLYNAIIEYKEPHYSKSLGDAVRDGTPLPKGCDIQRIIPKKVDIQKWTHTKCPNRNCNQELSTHHGDGYYTIDLKPDFCPVCGQALLWKIVI